MFFLQLSTSVTLPEIFTWWDAFILILGTSLLTLLKGFPSLRAKCSNQTTQMSNFHTNFEIKTKWEVPIMWKFQESLVRSRTARKTLREVLAHVELICLSISSRNRPVWIHLLWTKRQTADAKLFRFWIVFYEKLCFLSTNLLYGDGVPDPICTDVVAQSFADNE